MHSPLALCSILGTRSLRDLVIVRAVRRAIDKITAVLPEVLAEDAKCSAAYACASRGRPAISIDLTSLRRAVRSKHWVEICYTDESKKKFQRRIRPLCLVFIAPVWLVVTWCETRGEFRVDWTTSMKITDEQFRNEAGKTLRDLRQQKRREFSVD